MTKYTIQSGDTLGAIAKRFLGNSALYSKIAEANNIDNPNRISVGMELIIPDLEEPSSPSTSTEPTEDYILQADQLKAMLQIADDAVANKYLDAINQCLAKFEINTPLRVAHFIAQVGHESGSFKRVSENLNYGAAGLKAYFGRHFPSDDIAQAYERQPEKIANRAYANRMGNGDEASGEGWAYRGRGLIQLTGKENYQSFSDYCGVDLVSEPDRLVDDPVLCVAAAGWYWDSRNLNQYADEDDVKTITRKINGGLNGLEDRENRLENAKSALNA